MKPELDDYDTIIVAFSGGKDSTACLLHLLDLGVPKEKLELWHHLIDGEPGSEAFMDWPMTEDYCRDFAGAFEIPIYYSWRNGGFEREMLRDEQPTAPVSWEQPDGTVGSAGGGGKKNTRLMFPQVSNDLRVRWCSAYLKIDVMSIAINNQERFLDSKTLVITGERAQESKNRQGYKEFEDHRCNAPTKGRTVHQWRPIHGWDEAMVWSIIERYKVNAHPAYWLGWGRLSCMTCIFGNADQWTSASYHYPEMVERIAKYEEGFGVTIKRKESVRDLLDSGILFDSIEYSPTLIIEEEEWKLPPGALSGNDAGPT
jgi:3'-phosphoadenosine 5'-phosphosulfate sulfotransferase (PAPS reductase)/FAD synthetase